MSKILGDLEELVLIALQATKRTGAVTSIRQQLNRVGVVVSGGAIDRTLRRMEGKGLVSSVLSQEKRGAGQVRHWFLLDPGRESLMQAEKVRQALLSSC